MKVFLSWSGEHAHQVATAFSDWLPCVLQQIEVFISSNSIEAGDRWREVISEALDEIDFGIIFVTKENKEKPWLLFEAGALAKNIQKSKVIPILVDAEEIDLAKSPLLAFHFKKLDKQGVFDTVKSIHNSIENKIIDRPTLSKCLDKWWPDLEKSLTKVKTPKSPTKEKKLTEEDRLGRIEDAISNIFHTLSRDRKRVLPRSKSLDPTETFIDFLVAQISTGGSVAVKEVLSSIESRFLLAEALERLNSGPSIPSHDTIENLVRKRFEQLEIPF